MKNVVRYLRKVTFREGGDSFTDGDLLEAFLTRRDEAAFEALLRRHGPMVLGVCRRTLQNPHDAEDAFQATFLVLVRKASTIRPRELVGNWLYGVAYRTAMKARAMNTKRRIKEREAAGAARSADATANAQDDVLRRLDIEVNRLPEKYRAAVVLCELQGKSRKEAARLLGLAEGTLSWRLASARKTLARRLSTRGVPLSAGALTAALAGESAAAGVPPTLLGLTARAALQVAAGRTSTAGTVSAQVINLTEGVLKAMLLSKLKVFLAVALAVTIGAGATGLTYQAAAQPPARGKTPDLAQARDGSPRMRLALDELEELRLEVEALRKGLQTTRERVKSLEGEVDTLKRRATRTSMGSSMGGIGFLGGGGGLGMSGGGIGGYGGGGLGGGQLGGGGLGGGQGAGFSGGQGFSGGRSASKAPPSGLPGNRQQAAKPKPADDPFADAEKALKELRQHPDNKQATDQLERALQQLKQRTKQKEEPAK